MGKEDFFIDLARQHSFCEQMKRHADNRKGSNKKSSTRRTPLSPTLLRSSTIHDMGRSQIRTEDKDTIHPIDHVYMNLQSISSTGLSALSLSQQLPGLGSQSCSMLPYGGKAFHKSRSTHRSLSQGNDSGSCPSSANSSPCLTRSAHRGGRGGGRGGRRGR